MTAEVLFRNSERKDYRRCLQRWKWRYVDHLDNPHAGPSLVFGTLVHEALRLWYPKGRKRGIHPAESFERLFHEVQHRPRVIYDQDEEKHQALELGIAMLEHYVEFWGEDSHWRVVAVEVPFKLPVRNKAGKVIAQQVGRIDLMVLDLVTGLYWLVDHKTAKAIQTEYLELDSQSSGYLIAAEELLDVTVAGVIFNHLRKAPPDWRPQDEHGRYLNQPTKDALLRKAHELGAAFGTRTTVDNLTEWLADRGVNVPLLGEPSKQQPPPHFLRTPIYRNDYDKAMQLKRMRNELFEMRKRRAGELPIFKNDTHECARDCQFFDLCVMHETGADWQGYARQAYVTRDPYASYKNALEDYLGAA